MNIIDNRNIFFAISAVLVVSSIALMVVFGFHQSIEFVGGTLWRVRIAEEMPPAAAVEAFIREKLHVGEVRVSADTESQTFFIRLPVQSEEEHQRFIAAFVEAYPAFVELDFQSIGPSVGAALRANALTAVGLVLVGISLYIAVAFRKVSKPIRSWKYGVVTLGTLFHDLVIPAGLLAVLGSFVHVEVDSNFVVALLVVAGFSVHDTIVVFDRIRENLLRDQGKTSFGTVINQSINQTLRRSVNTSLTLILVLLALYFAGPENLRYFILTLLVGVTAGIYSSVFVASPVLLVVGKGKNTTS